MEKDLEYYISRADKEMQLAGLNHLNKVPDFFRPLYIKVMNLVKPLEGRLKKYQKELTHNYEALKSVENEIKDKLYGAGYNPTALNGKIGGLIGKRMELEEKIGKYDEVRKFLDQEIATTYQRRKKAKEQLEEKGKQGDAKAVWRLREDIGADDFYIEEYTKNKKVAEAKITIYGSLISRNNDDIFILKTLKDSIQDYLIHLEEDIEYFKIDYNELKPVESIAALLPSLEQKRKKHNEISQAYVKAYVNKAVNKDNENYHLRALLRRFLPEQVCLYESKGLEGLYRLEGLYS